MTAGVSTPLRILIATGDPQSSRVLADLVRRVGHHPILATEWFEREASRPHSIDLAVLDAELPGYPGVALAACARNNALALPLILMQNERIRLGTEWLARLGLLGILASPVDLDEFTSMLEGVTRPRLARGTEAGFLRRPT
jgi:DNA-binding NtrC family response regulator